MSNTKDDNEKNKNTLPDLENFYMIDQRVQLGGRLPTGLISVMNATQVICKRNGREFKTSAVINHNKTL